MHMALQDKLQLYASDNDTIVVPVEGQVTADLIVDAHLKATLAGKKLVLLHVGDFTTVARRTAERFGVTLVDASDPPTSPTTSVEPIVAHDEPEPEVAHAPLTQPQLPWDPSVLAPEPAPVVVPEEEFESMPWNVVHHQLLPAGRSTRPGALRPTQAPDWGLPWPRPQAQTDGIALADPKLWHAPERIQAIRGDLDAIGAPSFGVAKPEGSAWLKRLHEFGSP